MLLWQEKFYNKDTDEKTQKLEEKLKNLKSEFSTLEDSTKQLRSQHSNLQTDVENISKTPFFRRLQIFVQNVAPK